MTDHHRTWMPLLILVTVCGCARPGTVDLLEARLREQEEVISHLEEDLADQRAELAAARRETRALRDQLAGRDEKTVLPEQADVLYRATGIRFHKLLTGGDDADRIPGDELLSVLLIPHDHDGEPLKLPGEIQLDVSDPAMPEDRQRVGTWNFSVDESRDSWHRGFIGSGYLFRLPWQQIPQSSELLLHARMTTPDGRQFDASQMIHITPPVENANLSERGLERALREIDGGGRFTTFSAIQQEGDTNPELPPGQPDLPSANQPNP